MKWFTLIAAIMLLSSCALKAPMEGMPQGTVDIMSPDGTITTIDTVSYARKLQAQVVSDCLSYQREQRHAREALLRSPR